MATLPNKSNPSPRGADLKNLKNIVFLWSVVLVTSVIALFVLEGLAHLGKAMRSGDPCATFSKSGLYESTAYAEKLCKELQSVGITEPTAYVQWKGRPFHGDLINVDDQGIRRTEFNSNDSQALQLSFFGGSTTRGAGVEDKDTIPSLVARELNKTGRYRVKNCGEMAYFSTQEVMAFYLELMHGNIPDIAVFYDGVNDVLTAGYEPGDPAKFSGFQRWIDLQNSHLDWSDFLKSKWRSSCLFQALQFVGLIPKSTFFYDKQFSASLIEERSKRTVEAYLFNKNVISALAKQFGIKVYFFWQPYLFSQTKKHLSLREQETLNSSSPVLKEIASRVYSTVAAQSPSNLHNLSDVFDNVEGGIYYDQCHIAARGNEIVAREIVKTLHSSSGGAEGEVGQK